MRGRRKVVRIDSDGQPRDTVVSLDDGTELDRVYAVWWHLDTDSLARVDISLWGTVLHVVGEVDQVELQCPCCNEVLKHECAPSD